MAKVPNKIVNTMRGDELIKRTLTFFNADPAPTACRCPNMQVTVEKKNPDAEFKLLECQHCVPGVLDVTTGNDFARIAGFIAETRTLMGQR